MPSQSFADLGVSPAVRDALRRRGIDQPFPIQQAVIADVLAGRDVLVKSPTGSGKTLAFGIPLVERTESADARPAVLVLAPTRELATQIRDELHEIAAARGLRIAAVYGGVGIAKQSAQAARAHILVATPGRLEDLLARGAVRLDSLDALVLDEADRMLDMGFRPAVERIVRRCPADRQTLFFSATLDGVAGTLAATYTRDPVRHEHAPSGPGPEIEHRYVTVTEERRVETLVAELAAERDLALVFVRTKRGADRLVKRLDGHGVPALAIHANKSQRQRERALAQFEAGEVDTLVATDIAARGLDVDRITHVINFDPPADSETHTHRIGRTARAGRAGTAITLATASQQRELAGERAPRQAAGGGRRAGSRHQERPAASSAISRGRRGGSRRRGRSNRPSA